MAEENNEIKELIENFETRIKGLEENPLILNPLNFGIHTHNGFDGSSKLILFDIAKIVLPGATAAVAANFNHFYLAQQPIIVIDIRVIWSNAGGSGATLQVERLQGTEALDGGDLLLSATIDLTSTANTVVEGTLTNTISNRILERGDRLALKDANTLTAIANVTVYVTYKPTSSGHYKQI